MNLDTALEHLAEPGTALLAGGTDWYPSRGEQAPPERMLDVTRIEGLDRLSHGTKGTRIGAAVTWSTLIASPLPPAFDALKSCAREIGSMQIQNTATLVGNLCNASPAADGMPALLALDARIELASRAPSTTPSGAPSEAPSGVSTRLLPLADFVIGVRATVRRDDEIVTAIEIPPHAANTVSRFAKLGGRRYLVISIAMIALVIEADADGLIVVARVAVGSCSPVACRLPDLEHRLAGRHLHDPALADCVTADSVAVLSPIDDVRASAAYRRTAVMEMLRRMLTAAGTSAIGQHV